ncbi:MAG: phospholipase D family protein [Comamonadaceae bacterium]|nr:MAG: phospholipase D family protein [Comamonadaceae bacterium]
MNNSLAEPSRHWPRWLLLGALPWLLAACAGLPQDVDRPVSSALPPSTQTTLGQIARDRTPAAARASASGFLLLSGPQDAYGSRLALVREAQKTLDLQYYAIHADASSERLLRGVVSAARRGVRVRILLDDFHSTGRNALVMRMAFEPNIEMRMFNPVAGTRGSSLGRMWGSLTDFARVQQRMHNKLFLADNVMGVTGGRNLGDAYFGISEAANFVDMDVLAVGPIVQEMSRSFDTYWNNPRAYPVQSLITQEELARIRSQVLQGDGSESAEAADPGAAHVAESASPSPQQPSTGGASSKPSTNASASGGPAPPDGEPRPSPGGATPEQRARVWNKQAMDLKAVTYVWAPAVMLADKPTKIPLDDSALAQTEAAAGTPADASTPPAPSVAEGSTARPAASSPSADAAAAATPGDAGSVRTVPTTSSGDTVVDGLLKLMAQTRHELLIISPYFVPGADMKAAFAEARARGVRIRILTNSLASNDAPIAHVGYARHREELLDMGIELYEMRSEQASVGSAFGSSGGGATGESRSMLHSKVLVVDGRLLVIGSMNLDLRSQLQNTEIALLIRSRDLSREASQQIEEAMRTGAWHVEREGRALVWRAPQGSGLQDATADPDSSMGLRLLLKLLGPLAPDHLL